jgi:hypothetical protein
MFAGNKMEETIVWWPTEKRDIDEMIEKLMRLNKFALYQM